MRAGTLQEMVVVGLVAAGTIVGAAVMSRRGEHRVAAVLMLLAGGMHLVALSGGLAFVPGMLAAAPIILALVAFPPERSGARYACVSLLAALPLVWAFQFLGGAAPQWAGRYTLPTCIGLLALPVAGLGRADLSLPRGLVALTALVSTHEERRAREECRD